MGRTMGGGQMATACHRLRHPIIVNAAAVVSGLFSCAKPSSAISMTDQASILQQRMPDLSLPSFIRCGPQLAALPTHRQAKKTKTLGRPYRVVHPGQRRARARLPGSNQPRYRMARETQAAATAANNGSAARTPRVSAHPAMAMPPFRAVFSNTGAASASPA